MAKRASPGGPQALPDALRAPIGGFALLCAVVLAAIGLALAGDDVATPLDAWAGTGLSSLLPRSAFLYLIDYGGEPVGAAILVSVVAGLALAARRWRLSVVAIAGLALTGGAVTVLKSLFDRTINGGNLAYPSGHTATATVLAIVLMLLVVDLVRPRTGPAVLIILGGAFIVGAGMAVDQVALDAHYLTDTIGGFCTAVIVVIATAWLVDTAESVVRRRTATT